MYVVSQLEDGILRHTLINKGKEYYHISDNTGTVLSYRRVTSPSLRDSISAKTMDMILNDEKPHIPLYTLIPREYHEQFVSGTDTTTNIETIGDILSGTHERFNYMLNSNYV